MKLKNLLLAIMVAVLPLSCAQADTSADQYMEEPTPPPAASKPAFDKSEYQIAYDLHERPPAPADADWWVDRFMPSGSDLSGFQPPKFKRDQKWPVYYGSVFDSNRYLIGGSSFGFGEDKFGLVRRIRSDTFPRLDFIFPEFRFQYPGGFHDSSARLAVWAGFALSWSFGRFSER